MSENQEPKPEQEAPAQAAAALSKEEIAQILKIRADKKKRDRKRVLDKDDPFYLAGLLTFAPGEFERYTPLWARAVREECEYRIRPFSREAIKRIDASMTVEENREAVLAGFKEGAIIGWKRMTFGGKPIEFSHEEIDRMPDDDIKEIGERCYAYATGILPEEAEGLE